MFIQNAIYNFIYFKVLSGFLKYDVKFVENIPFPFKIELTMKKLLGIITITFVTCFMVEAQASLNMKLAGTLDGLGTAYTDIWGYQHGAKEFVVIGSNTAINIVDITDCQNPTLESQIVDGSNTSWRDFKEYGDYIYAVCDVNCSEGLQIINKNTYAMTQSTSEFLRCHNLFIDEKAGRMYAVGTNTSVHGMYVYDIETDPANPILLKNVEFRTIQNDPSGNYYVHDVFVQNDTAYCSHGFQGYMIWDTKDLDNVSRIGFEANIGGGYNHSSWPSTTNDYAYVAKETHGKAIEVFDISDITDPLLVNSFIDPLLAPNVTNAIAHNPFVHLDKLYISYYHDGVKVYDISDELNPTLFAYYDTYPDNTNYSGFNGTWGIWPFSRSGCIAASDITYGLQLIQLTTPPSPDSRVSDGSIVLLDNTKGIVFRNPANDEIKRITVDGDGGIIVNDLGSLPSGRTEIMNSNLDFTSSFESIILRAPNNSFYKLLMTNSGDLDTELLTSAPTNFITIESEDLYFSHFRSGFVLKSPNNTCYHTTIGGFGTLEVTQITCN